MAIRHILVDDYFRADPDKLWLTIERDIPELKKQIQAIVQRLS